MRCGLWRRGRTGEKKRRKRGRRMKRKGRREGKEEGQDKGKGLRVINYAV